MRFEFLTLCLTVSLINCYESNLNHETPNRVMRSTTNRKHHQLDCRYEKGVWEECDLTTGQQKRVLRLKTSRSMSNDCEPEKLIERPCKKNCRYSKGVWTDCINGSKTRIDTIKTEPSPGCESTRNVTKACKEQCNYQKSEWSPCENGVKIKTLTLQSDPGANSGCEATKIIRKQCGHRQNRRERVKAKKPNLQNNNPTEE